MSEFAQRFEQGPLFADHHERIRNLEALVSTGGSDPGVCPDCVLDPFTVNPGDIFVPDIFRDCVNIAGLGAADGPSSFDVTCNNSPISPLFSGAALGYCSYIGLGKPLGLQINVSTALGSNIENIIVYAGNPEGQVFAKGWEPGESPPSYSSGWVDVDAALCGFASCTPITLGATFAPHNTFAGSCVGPGIVAARYVVLNDEGNFRGALDDIPLADSDGDVVFFSSETHEFLTGPARRRTSYFMG